MCDIFHHLAKLLCIPFLNETDNKNYQLLIAWVLRMLCSVKYQGSLHELFYLAVA